MVINTTFSLAVPTAGLADAGTGAVGLKAPVLNKEYDWKRLTASVLFTAAQVLLFTYPEATGRLAQILPFKIAHDIWGTLCNVGLSVYLDLYLQSKREDQIWSDPSRWNPMTISSFIFFGYVMGISCRNVNAGLERFGFWKRAAPMGWFSRSIQGVWQGQGFRLPNMGPLLLFGLKSVVINTAATPLWAIGNLPWLMTMEGPLKERCEVYWASVRKNFEWGWTRRALAFSFAPTPTHGLFYLFNHGGMAFQQMEAVDEATKLKHS